MSAFDTSTSQTTTLPSWFTNAQQNLATNVTSGLASATAPNQTVGQNAVQQLSGPSNPFTTGTATLQDIASGVANPWLPNGQPNTNTTLGGLFSAQNAKLDQILPAVAAKEGAVGIGSGNYGGLRGQTAVDAARAGALTDLATNQNQTAVNALNTGVQAEAAAGNLGQQYNAAALNTANWQQLGGLPTLAQAGNVLNSMAPNVGNTVNKTTNQGLTANIAQAAALPAALQKAGLSSASAAKTGLGWLDSILNGTPSGTYVAGGTGTSATGITTPDNLPEGAQPIYDSSNTYIGYTDSNGNFVDAGN